MTKNDQHHYAGELEQMQSLPLDAKIAMTKRRIREWFDAFGGDERRPYQYESRLVRGTSG